MPQKRVQNVRRVPRSKQGVISVGQLAPDVLVPESRPKTVEPTIKVSKRVEIFVDIGESGTATVANGALMAGVPGGSTYWQKFRIERIDAWGSDQVVEPGVDNIITLTSAASPGWDQPNFQVRGVGVAGQARPRAGFRLGLLDRARWYGTADSNLLMTIGGPANSRVTVQASVELISPALAIA